MNETLVLGRQLRFEQLLFWRNRSQVFFTFVFPLLLLVIFVAIFGHGPDAAKEKLTLIPGIAALALVSTTFQALAIALAFHRDQGVFKRIIATPLRLRTLVAGKLISSGIVAVIEIALIVVAGRFVYGFHWPREWGTFVAVVAMGVITFSALGMAVAALIPSGDAAPAITNAVYLPMMFVSGVFYPISDMPNWLVDIARVLPLYHLAVPFRAIYTGANAHLAEHVGVLAIWLVVSVLFAVRRFRWEPAR